MKRKQYRYKKKACTKCSASYKPTGGGQKYCPPCGVIEAKATNVRSVDAYKRRRGVRVGISHVDAQRRGPDSPLFKNGYKMFARFKAAALQTIRFCERCKKDLLNVGVFGWVVHHKDHNHYNNEPTNWEVLCRRCHHMEHEGWLRLPQYRVDRIAA